MYKWLLLLSLSCALPLFCHADSYLVINDSENPLRIHSKATTMSSLKPATKTQTFELPPGGKERIDFESPYRLYLFHIYPTDHLEKSFFYNPDPAIINGPSRHYRFVVEPDLTVKHQEPDQANAELSHLLDDENLLSN